MIDPFDLPIILAGCIAFVLGMYFLPLIVAMARDHRQVLAISAIPPTTKRRDNEQLGIRA
jgi:hypothetical protein